MIYKLIIIIVALCIACLGLTYLLNESDSRCEQSDTMRKLMEKEMEKIARKYYMKGLATGVSLEIVEYGNQEFDLSEEPDILDGIDFSLIDKLNNERHDTLFYDPISRQTFYSNIDRIRQMVNQLND